MKQSYGFTKPTPTVITIVTMIASFGLLSISMKTLPLGTAYTIWTGIGAVGAFLIGIIILGEQVSIMRIGAEIGRAQSELQSLMRISYAVFCLKKKKKSNASNKYPANTYINKQQDTKSILCTYYTVSTIMYS